MSIVIDDVLVQAVRRLALAAGEAIMAVYRTDFAVEDKSDASPVTEADRRAEAIILEGLAAPPCPPFPVIAEEEVAAGRVPEVGDGPFWLVDPLDGTKQFVKRQGEFTVNIALIEHGLPVLGVVHAPAIGATYWASPLGAFAATDGGAPQPIHCRPMPAKGLIAVASRSHRNRATDEFLARFDIAEAISSGSSIKFCLVASGKADLYPRTGRTMEWDTAAGHAVVRYAGGSVSDMAGNPLRYGKPGYENPHFVVRGAPATA